MTSRVLSRLQTLLSAFALLIVLASLAPAPAQAKVYYEIDDRFEGDPGDGVLDPSAASSGGTSGGTSTNLISSSSDLSLSDSWFLTLSDCYLFSVYLPGITPARSTVIFLPWDWSPLRRTFLPSQGRWHDAP